MLLWFVTSVDHIEITSQQKVTSGSLNDHQYSNDVRPVHSCGRHCNTFTGGGFKTVQWVSSRCRLSLEFQVPWWLGTARMAVVRGDEAASRLKH